MGLTQQAFAELLLEMHGNPIGRSQQIPAPVRLLDSDAGLAEGLVGFRFRPPSVDVIRLILLIRLEALQGGLWTLVYADAHRLQLARGLAL